MKTILIAVPTAKYIEPKTFKSIYDLEIPDGYSVEFNYCISDQIDQIRNLIADWAKHYDYLFSVDSDITFRPDTLKKMLYADKDMISGLYIQRKSGHHILELYQDSPNGGVENIPYSAIKNLEVIPIAACGFGCVLIKSDLFRKMPYPHFVYQSAIDHANTISEDIYFCNNVRRIGHTIWADVSIQCEHIGTTKFIVDPEYNKSAINIPTKAYILKNNNEISEEYAKIASESCDKVNLKWEYHNGFENMTRQEVLKSYKNGSQYMDDRAACCTASHFEIWKKIYENRETAIILEHDSVMLHPVNMHIPDNLIVALGYKLKNPKVYNHIKAGPPTEIIPIRRFSGSHAYAITWKTAKLLLDELEREGVNRSIDCFYFMRINDPGDTESNVPLAIASPTPSICWLRKSTIWDESSTLNYDLIESFTSNIIDKKEITISF